MFDTVEISQEKETTLRRTAGQRGFADAMPGAVANLSAPTRGRHKDFLHLVGRFYIWFPLGRSWQVVWTDRLGARIVIFRRHVGEPSILGRCGGMVALQFSAAY